MENKSIVVTVGAPLNGSGVTVDSVFGRTGHVIAENGDYNTDQVTEGVTNKYFQEAPIDGKEYARKDANWVEVQGGVISVNGETGVVVLDGTEIELIENGGVSVTQAISDIDTQVQGNTTSIANNASSIGQNASDISNLDTEKASNTDLSNHVNDTNNPHNTTKAQVGLSEVDNTSDADKPISTATQSALDANALNIGLLDNEKINYTDNPSKTQAAGIRAFYDDTTSTLEISIDGTNIP